jgi:hypothetical protein
MDEFAHYASDDDVEGANEPSSSSKPRNLPIEILDLGALRSGEKILVPLYVEEACWVIGKYRHLLSPPGQSGMRELLYLPKELDWRAENNEATQTISGRSLLGNPHTVSWIQRWDDYDP